MVGSNLYSLTTRLDHCETQCSDRSRLHLLLPHHRRPLHRPPLLPRHQHMRLQMPMQPSLSCASHRLRVSSERHKFHRPLRRIRLVISSVRKPTPSISSEVSYSQSPEIGISVAVLFGAQNMGPETLGEKSRIQWAAHPRFSKVA